MNAQARDLAQNEARSHLRLLFSKMVMWSLFIRDSLIQQKLSENKNQFVILGPARNCGFRMFHWNLAKMVIFNMNDHHLLWRQADTVKTSRVVEWYGNQWSHLCHKSGYFFLIWVKVWLKKMAFSSFMIQIRRWLFRQNVSSFKQEIHLCACLWRFECCTFTILNKYCLKSCFFAKNIS